MFSNNVFKFQALENITPATLPLPDLDITEGPAVSANPIQDRRTGVLDPVSTEDAQVTHPSEVIMAFIFSLLPLYGSVD